MKLNYFGLILISYFSIFVNNLYGQNNDTVIVTLENYKEFEPCAKKKYFVREDSLFIFSNKEYNIIFEDTIKYVNLSYDTFKSKYFYDLLNNKYIIFLDLAYKKQFEGRFKVEGFSGYCKEYFSNEVIKGEGYFDENNLIKIGYWKYYNKDGSVKKIAFENKKHSEKNVNSSHPALIYPIPK